MINTLIVPGLDGSPAPHWQDWWAASDPRALTVELSDPQRPVAAVWEIELASMILQHPDCILVGHSLGSVLIARLLTQWPHLRVRGALLVAPAETQGTDRLTQFGPIPEAPLDVPTTVVASRNDPWMSYGRSAQLARAWGAELVDQGFAGHINVAAGYGPWPEAKKLRDRLLQEDTVFAPACGTLGRFQQEIPMAAKEHHLGRRAAELGRGLGRGLARNMARGALRGFQERIAP